MQHYGALSPDFDPQTGPLDLDALDQAYYRLFHPGADDSGLGHIESSPAK
jgi:hypothetical protein